MSLSSSFESKFMSLSDNKDRKQKKEAVKNSTGYFINKTINNLIWVNKLSFIHHIHSIHQHILVTWTL